MPDFFPDAASANRLVLAAGAPMLEKLRAAAMEWQGSGRSPQRLLTGKALLVSQCWLYGTGNDKPEGPAFDKSISDFVEASRTAIGGEAGWNALLSEKDECPGCRLVFHLENIAICTGCMEYVCGACQSNHRNCAGEIVG